MWTCQWLRNDHSLRLAGQTDRQTERVSTKKLNNEWNICGMRNAVLCTIIIIIIWYCCLFRAHHELYISQVVLLKSVSRVLQLQVSLPHEYPKILSLLSRRLGMRFILLIHRSIGVFVGEKGGDNAGQHHATFSFLSPVHQLWRALLSFSSGGVFWTARNSFIH